MKISFQGWLVSAQRVERRFEIQERLKLEVGLALSADWVRPQRYIHTNISGGSSQYEAMEWMDKRIPILCGESGASVVRIDDGNGFSLIEKRGPSAGILAEAAVLKWCALRLPVPRVVEQREGVLVMNELPGRNLADVSLADAVSALVEALELMHAMPVEDCPFSAAWSLRLQQAEQRLEAGLVDEGDFDDENLGRSAADILAELKSFPPLPELICFTHGDACLENFLSFRGRLSGIVDLGRAGLTHPAQDWALALRSVSSGFCAEGVKMLRRYLPVHSASEDLLRRFRLLDEFF